MTDHETSAVDIVIIGGSGDLSWRKLLPALYMAELHARLDDGSRILAVGRQAWERERYVRFVDEMSRPQIEAACWQERAWARLLARLDYLCLDASRPEGYAALARLCRPGSTRVFYLATAPHLFTDIARHLDAAGLIDANARLVLEKPLGHDLASAQAINESVSQHFQERQIYRIDHYLGKETVQNLMVLRFGNAILEPLWRAPSIRSVQITVAESVGVGLRAGFYDTTGALRDMVQNHLLQVLCFVAMEPPVSLAPDDVRDEKLKVLRCLHGPAGTELARDTVRGQYTAGVVESEAVPGYRQEPEVPEGSRTETFVALRTQIHNARWAGTPFFLRTGKRLPRRHSEILIEFAEPPFSLFADQVARQPNRLLITLQPEESIRLEMMAKEPGSGLRLQPVSLNLDLASAFPSRRADAYERLLLDVIKGRLTHFMRRDETEAAWRWTDPILQGWQQLGTAPAPYPAGSWGPPAAAALVARDNVTWAEAH